ncbi:putative secreted RxLR effector protein [Phytophthora cinnamomi]|uniref:putative secreted RxLR effector protein n=1 Tax=Phytophthora cinnamomi TaxID=4785 RepID=UPI002B289969|nr:putative secreted RxLR effector protein [Phytophthora cinnamomi]QVE55548.1 RxLR effector protein 36b [Phytophthora cinnamomi]
MRLSLLSVVTAALTLLASGTAESADKGSHRGLRSVSSSEELHDIKVHAVDEGDDSEEERGGNGLSSAALKWKKIRTSVRLKELEEVLSIAKTQVKAAVQAAVKAKQIEAVAKFLDDTTVEKMVKNVAYRSDVFKGWHDIRIEPQTVFTTIAESGKYTGAKWTYIGDGYLEYVTDIAKAAAKRHA